MNGDFILAQSTKLADRLIQESPKLKPELTAFLPKLLKSPISPWQFGYGNFDESTQKTGSFTELPHWTGTTWQGGKKLPDAKLGWAFLNANGGHPDTKSGTIRRWIATETGTLSISGNLGHGSENGNGVRGRIVSSRTGLAGSWIAKNNSTETKVLQLAVQSGDTIDFITDGNGNVTSDSFSWTVQLTLTRSDASTFKWDSVAQFHGPPPAVQNLAAQASYAFELALCRKPTLEELQLVVGFLGNQIMYLQQHPEKLPKGVTSDKQAITNLCQALMSSNEFLYVD